MIETLHAIAALDLLPDDIEHRIDQFGPFGVMPFRPIIPGSGLPEHKIIGPKDLAVGPGPDGIHCTGLQIHEDGAWDVPPLGRLVEIDIDSLQLRGRCAVAFVFAGGVDVVLRADHLPEFRPDLVPALASLDVENFPHFFSDLSESSCAVLLFARNVKCG